jgi:hypothetical protein
MDGEAARLIQYRRYRYYIEEFIIFKPQILCTPYSEYYLPDTGYIFCPILNILSDIPSIRSGIEEFSVYNCLVLVSLILRSVLIPPGQEPEISPGEEPGPGLTSAVEC